MIFCYFSFLLTFALICFPTKQKLKILQCITNKAIEICTADCLNLELDILQNFSLIWLPRNNHQEDNYGNSVEYEPHWPTRPVFLILVKHK